MLINDTHIIATKNYIDMTTIFFKRRQKVRKVGKKSEFLTSGYFAVEFFKVNAWLSSHTVCQIGLSSNGKCNIVDSIMCCDDCIY
jgi:hypothetical protein